MAKARFIPTEGDRQIVKSMVAYGIRQEAICALILRQRGKAPELVPISKRTLQRHFKEELGMGLDRAVLVVADSLFKRAIDVKHPQGAACAMFFLKCRAGWNQNVSVAVTGVDGEAIEMALDLSKAPPEDLTVLNRYLSAKALTPANAA
jgi:hypothetical protein